MATVIKAPMPSFTGRYAQIRKEFYKGIVLAKYDPARSEYKTEAGFHRAQVKEFEKKMAKIDRIERAGTLINATVTITWSRGGTYGKQAKATVKYSYMTPDGTIRNNIVEGDPTTGMGYDKTSTAWAHAANKIPEFMKLLLDARVKKKKLPYGVDLNTGEPYMPGFHGGVGINSFNKAMEALGYNVDEFTAYPSIVAILNYTIKRKPAVRRSRSWSTHAFSNPASTAPGAGSSRSGTPADTPTIAPSAATRRGSWRNPRGPPAWEGPSHTGLRTSGRSEPSIRAGTAGSIGSSRRPRGFPTTPRR